MLLWYVFGRCVGSYYFDSLFFSNNTRLNNVILFSCRSIATWSHLFDVFVHSPSSKATGFDLNEEQQHLTGFSDSKFVCDIKCCLLVMRTLEYYFTISEVEVIKVKIF